MAGGIEIKKGDTIIVKRGVRDEEGGFDMGGWKGTVTLADDEMADVTWSGETLRRMSDEVLQLAEDMDIYTYTIALEDIEVFSFSETPEEYKLAKKEVQARLP